MPMETEWFTIWKCPDASTERKNSSSYSCFSMVISCKAALSIAYEGKICRYLKKYIISDWCTKALLLLLLLFCLRWAKNCKKNCAGISPKKPKLWERCYNRQSSCRDLRSDWPQLTFFLRSLGNCHIRRKCYTLMLICRAKLLYTVVIHERLET